MSESGAYWEKCWQRENEARVEGYLDRWEHREMSFLSPFSDHGVRTVCDAACGFGAMSLVLSRHGFEVSGFDLSARAVEITETQLNRLHAAHGEYVQGDILHIPFADGLFDAVVAHSVLDHLTDADSSRALSELFRIVKPGGMVYVSFDQPEEEDYSRKHDILTDGSMVYTEGARAGLLFRPCGESEIDKLCAEYTVLQRGINARGERERLLCRR